MLWYISCKSRRVVPNFAQPWVHDPDHVKESNIRLQKHATPFWNLYKSAKCFFRVSYKNYHNFCAVIRTFKTSKRQLKSQDTNECIVGWLSMQTQDMFDFRTKTYVKCLCFTTSSLKNVK